MHSTELPRRALVLQGTHTSVDLGRALAAHGWVVTHHSDLAGFRARRDADQPAVRVAVLDSGSAFSPADLRALLTADRGEWLALVSRELASEPTIARMLADGFYDFHTLPLDLARLEVVMGHLHGRAVLREQLRVAASRATAPPQELAGASPAGIGLLRAVDKVARVDAPLLITGETGSGKDAVARAVHERSERRHGPFVVLGCGPFLDDAASDAFGRTTHGADAAAHARLAEADRGTLYLDEVNALPLDAQGGLLRFLEAHTTLQTGGAMRGRPDVRVIAATRVDLADEVRAGRFREDLYYRLHVLQVHVPPLRERGEDVLLLAEQVLAQQGPQHAPAVRGFSPEARAAIAAHGWPGNVRELVSRVLRALLMCEGVLITPADLGLSAPVVRTGASSLEQARSIADRDLILSALERNRQNMAATARELGISRVTLYRLVRKLAIERSRARRRGSIARGAAGRASALVADRERSAESNRGGLPRIAQRVAGGDGERDVAATVAGSP